MNTKLEMAAVFTGNKVTRLINEQGDNALDYDDLAGSPSTGLMAAAAARR